MTASNRSNTAGDVWGNAHELRPLVAVSHVLDNCRQKEGDGVEGSINACKGY